MSLGFAQTHQLFCKKAGQKTFAQNFVLLHVNFL